MSGRVKEGSRFRASLLSTRNLFNKERISWISLARKRWPMEHRDLPAHSNYIKTDSTDRQARCYFKYR